MNRVEMWMENGTQICKKQSIMYQDWGNLIKPEKFKRK